MRNSIIAVIVGLVVGIVVGVTVISPRLELASGDGANRTKIDVQGRRPDGESIATIPLAPRPPEPAVQWKMASAYGARLPQLGTLAKRLETHLRRHHGNPLL